MVMQDVDVSRNILYLTGDIVEKTVPYFITGINYLVEQNGDREILVYINSYGGDMYSAFGIIDYMRVCNVKIGMACYGAAMSGAAMILINATGEKVMSKHSYLMLHPPWINEDLDMGEFHMKDLKNKIFDNLVLCSNKDKEFWKVKLESNFYINAREALEFKMIHRVLSH
jgi:ATP-dependent Clp protease protease subunit|tara:strand:- start:2573 stop:3082 length:510 start_codon:yes stop_codon:yes gene_type:complete